jgi:hypothetical protein
MIERFYSIVNSIDSLSGRLNTATRIADESLAEQLEKITEALSLAESATEKLSVKGGEKISELNALIGDLQRFVERMNGTLSDADSVINELDKSDNLLWGEQAARVNKQLIQLRHFVQDVQDGAARLKLIITRMKEEP